MMMVLWISFLTLLCCCFTEAENTELDRIERCQTKCSQGLSCRTKADYWFPPACLEHLDHLNTSVFHNVSVSPVMTCAGKQKCKLNLRVKAVLELSEFIHGLSICTVSAGMMRNCQKIVFTKTSRTKLSGLLVRVDNDCTEISPSQQVQVTIKTIPDYCGTQWTSNYHPLGCMMEDLRRNVPECITGRLSYNTNLEKNELQINVSDMLEDHTYHLRLCHKDDYICAGTGDSTQIEKEQPVKSAILRYTRPLPCLCIEGWSAVVDAPRVRVCPFQDRLEELWLGITFDPLEEALLWEPACPVNAVAALCEKKMDGTCVDLPEASQNVSRGKLKFAKVDPRPQLCMKFTIGSQSWVRCPFRDGIKAWDFVVTNKQGHRDVQLVSQIPATFSVGFCGRSANSTCQKNSRSSVHVLKANNPTLIGKACNSCLQVKRQDVKYAANVVHCFDYCSQESRDLTWIVLPAAVCLTGIIIVNLVLHLLLSVYQRRKKERERKQTDSKLNCVASTMPTVRGSLFLTDPPQCRSNEKANLISK
uniref:Interleukin-17 receptor C/E N-terminal domain-containing protein n=1 Tax=Oryzias latipes TaxID=8090 RepID=A0A3P9JXF9_ORYLA